MTTKKANKTIDASPDQSASQTPKPIKPPAPPPWLGKEAKKEYRRVAGTLFKWGLLTELDRAALAGYAVAYERWAMATAGIAKYGLVMEFGGGEDKDGNAKAPTYAQQSPYVSIANAAAKEMKAFMTEIGLTPRTRQRLDVAEPETVDLFEAFQMERPG